MKTVIRLILIVLLIGTMCSVAACSYTEPDTSTYTSKSYKEKQEDEVRSAIKAQAVIESGGPLGGVTIGGNKIRPELTQITISTLVEGKYSWEYTAYGTITMTDVYGTNWKNQFTCTVEKTFSSDYKDYSWECSDFEYVNKNWSKN